ENFRPILTGGHHGHFDAGSFQRANQCHRSFICFHSTLMKQSEKRFVLEIAGSVDGVKPGWIIRFSQRQFYLSRLKKTPDSVFPCLSVDIYNVVGTDVE